MTEVSDSGVGKVRVRKWNSNLSPADNLRANFKQPVVRLNAYSAIAWSLLWIFASFLASMAFDRDTMLTYFLAAPVIAFGVLTCGAYVGLPQTAFGRGVVDLEVRAAGRRGLPQWGATVVYVASWLPFVRSGDPGWVAATNWIPTAVAGLAGFQAGVGLLALTGGPAAANGEPSRRPGRPVRG